MSGLAAEIESVRFTPVRLRDGYDMMLVDDLLDRLAAAARTGAPLAPLVASARVEVSALGEGYDIDEVDAFLMRITGRTIAKPAPVREGPQPSAAGEAGGPLARLRSLLRRSR